MAVTDSDHQNNQLSEQSARALRELYRQEEVNAERKINRITLLFGIFFLLFVLLILPAVTDTPLNNPNVVSNVVGISIITVYNLIIWILLRKEMYHPVIKYITIAFLTSIITLVVSGYSIGVDHVHSTRTISVTSFFLVIIVSGLYQNPKLPVFSCALVCAEYIFLFFEAVMAGEPVYLRMETFRENILTWDILVVYLVIFSGAGLLMFLNTLRHRKMAVMLQKSSEDLYREMEERRRSDEKAKFFENYDRLTQLPNAKHFQERLEGQILKAESRKQIFAVMCMGIDAFKNVNQLYGTEKGHTVLRDIGMRLKGAFREDDFVSRFMGDKFLVLFCDLHSSYNISDLIKKTREALEEPFFVSGVRIKISAGAGICTFPSDGLTAETLIENAETAMYGAKGLGKDIFQLYDQALQKELDTRINLERELHEAVEHGEFTVVYQPKVDLHGRVRGMEALLRWKSPSRGWISPGEFIPIAERSGLIVEIGYHVMDLCCRQAQAWSLQGIAPVRITVNVSPYQFGRRDFIDKMEEIVGKYAVESGWLGIEVTESGIMENEDECIEKMNALKDMNMTISIDDFGKGYSSLTRLGSYPVNTLKIDKSFVDGLPGTKTAACITRSIIDLAHNLGYDVVAEGVETREQVDFLAENGCDLYQGYFFHKPLPSAEMEKLLTT